MICLPVTAVYPLSLKQLKGGQGPAGGKAVRRHPVVIGREDEPGEKLGTGRLVIRHQFPDLLPAGAQNRIVLPGQSQAVIQTQSSIIPGPGQGEVRQPGQREPGQGANQQRRTELKAHRAAPLKNPLGTNKAGADLAGADICQPLSL